MRKYDLGLSGWPGSVRKPRTATGIVQEKPTPVSGRVCRPHSRAPRLTDDVEPSPALDAVLEVERRVRSALDVSRAHAADLAGNEEQRASAAELGALVPASEIPLHGGEEEAARGADEEADHVELLHVGDSVLGQRQYSPDQVGRGDEVAGGEARHLVVMEAVSWMALLPWPCWSWCILTRRVRGICSVMNPTMYVVFR